jgi:hypothetical protein
MFFILILFLNPIVIEDKYILEEFVVEDDALFLPDENGN